MDPGSSDCQPRCACRGRAGAETPPPDRSLLLLDALLGLSLLGVGESWFKPKASPLQLLASRGLVLSAAACAEVSISWVPRLAAAALPMPAMHKAPPISQCDTRMAIEPP